MVRATKTRDLGANEIIIARSVFKNTLPYDKIIISNGLGGGNRPFTLPTNMPVSPLFNVKGGKYVIHAGNGYFGMSTLRNDKELLIHELVHVWQGEHSSNTWNYVLNSMWDQALKDDAYKYDEKRLKDWSEYGPEQQAKIIEDWYVDGMKKTENEDLRFYYVKKHIWGEKVSHDWIRAAYAIKPLESGSLNVKFSYPTMDSYLIPILKKRYKATDVVGYTSRVKKLEELFNRIEPQNIHELLSRLEVRRHNDKVSEYFHDHLSTYVRTKLTNLLRLRLRNLK